MRVMLTGLLLLSLSGCSEFDGTEEGAVTRDNTVAGNGLYGPEAKRLTDAEFNEMVTQTHEMLAIEQTNRELDRMEANEQIPTR